MKSINNANTDIKAILDYLSGIALKINSDNPTEYDLDVFGKYKYSIEQSLVYLSQIYNFDQACKDLLGFSIVSNDGIKYNSITVRSKNHKRDIFFEKLATARKIIYFKLINLKNEIFSNISNNTIQSNITDIIDKFTEFEYSIALELYNTYLQYNTFYVSIYDIDREIYIGGNYGGVIYENINNIRAKITKFINKDFNNQNDNIKLVLDTEIIHSLICIKYNILSDIKLILETTVYENDQEIYTKFITDEINKIFDQYGITSVPEYTVVSNIFNCIIKDSALVSNDILLYLNNDPNLSVKIFYFEEKENNSYNNKLRLYIKYNFIDEKTLDTLVNNINVNNILLENDLIKNINNDYFMRLSIIYHDQADKVIIYDVSLENFITKVNDDNKNIILDSLNNLLLLNGDTFISKDNYSSIANNLDALEDLNVFLSKYITDLTNDISRYTNIIIDDVILLYYKCLFAEKNMLSFNFLLEGFTVSPNKGTKSNILSTIDKKVDSFIETMKNILDEDDYSNTNNEIIPNILGFIKKMTLFNMFIHIPKITINTKNFTDNFIKNNGAINNSGVIGGGGKNTGFPIFSLFGDSIPSIVVYLFGGMNLNFPKNTVLEEFINANEDLIISAKRELYNSPYRIFFKNIDNIEINLESTTHNKDVGRYYKILLIKYLLTVSSDKYNNEEIGLVYDTYTKEYKENILSILDNESTSDNEIDTIYDELYNTISNNIEKSNSNFKTTQDLIFNILDSLGTVLSTLYEIIYISNNIKTLNYTDEYFKWILNIIIFNFTRNTLFYGVVYKDKTTGKYIDIDKNMKLGNLEASSHYIDLYKSFITKYEQSKKDNIPKTFKKYDLFKVENSFLKEKFNTLNEKGTNTRNKLNNYFNTFDNSLITSVKEEYETYVNKSIYFTYNILNNNCKIKNYNDYTSLLNLITETDEQLYNNIKLLCDIKVLELYIKDSIAIFLKDIYLSIINKDVTLYNKTILEVSNKIVLSENNINTLYITCNTIDSSISSLSAGIKLASSYGLDELKRVVYDIQVSIKDIKYVNISYFGKNFNEVTIMHNSLEQLSNSIYSHLNDSTSLFYTMVDSGFEIISSIYKLLGTINLNKVIKDIIDCAYYMQDYISNNENVLYNYISKINIFINEYTVDENVLNDIKNNFNNNNNTYDMYIKDSSDVVKYYEQFKSDNKTFMIFYNLLSSKNIDTFTKMVNIGEDNANKYFMYNYDITLHYTIVYNSTFLLDSIEEDSYEEDIYTTKKDNYVLNTCDILNDSDTNDITKTPEKPAYDTSNQRKLGYDLVIPEFNPFLSDNKIDEAISLLKQVIEKEFTLINNYYNVIPTSWKYMMEIDLSSFNREINDVIDNIVNDIHNECGSGVLTGDINCNVLNEFIDYEEYIDIKSKSKKELEDYINDVKENVNNEINNLENEMIFKNTEPRRLQSDMNKFRSRCPDIYNDSTYEFFKECFLSYFDVDYLHNIYSLIKLSYLDYETYLSYDDFNKRIIKETLKINNLNEDSFNDYRFDNEKYFIYTHEKLSDYLTDAYRRKNNIKDYTKAEPDSDIKRLNELKKVNMLLDVNNMYKQSNFVSIPKTISNTLNKFGIDLQDVLSVDLIEEKLSSCKLVKDIKDKANDTNKIINDYIIKKVDNLISRIDNPVLNSSFGTIKNYINETNELNISVETNNIKYCI